MAAPIYHDLSSKIEQYIRENNLKNKLPGTRTLAKKFNVHHVTLLKALHLLKNKGLITIVPASGIYIVPPAPARTKHNVIAIVGMTNQEFFLNKKFVNLEKIFQNTRYNVITISFDSSIFKNNKKILLNFPVDGFLFRFSSLRDEQRQLLENENIPFVSCARREDLPNVTQTDCDHDYGYGLMVDKLIQLGHRQIAFCEFSRIPEYQSYLDNIYKVFKEKLGGDFTPDLFYAPCSSEDLYDMYNENHIKVYMTEALKQLLSLRSPPTAIIAPMPMCRELISLLTQKGIRVPQDISIMAMAYKVQHTNNPDISCVIYDDEEMLCWGAKQLLKKLDDPFAPPECYLQKPLLHDGKTVAPCKKY